MYITACAARHAAQCSVNEDDVNDFSREGRRTLMSGCSPDPNPVIQILRTIDTKLDEINRVAELYKYAKFHCNRLRNNNVKIWSVSTQVKDD